ncbi:MAG: hypothetical protein ACI8W7_004212 [Gammaproteobacteria bacterium]|jgi:hypothetical protein
MGARARARALLNNHRIFNAGDDVHGRTNIAGGRRPGATDLTAAAFADLDVDVDVDVDDSFQTLRPGLT